MWLKKRLPDSPRVRLGMRAKLILGFLVVMFPALLLLLASDYGRYAERKRIAIERSRVTGQAAVALVQADLDAIAAVGSLIVEADGAHLHEILASHPE